MSSQFARLRGALDRVGTTTPGTIVGVFAEDLSAIMNHYVEVVREVAELKAARAQPAQAETVTYWQRGTTLPAQAGQVLTDEDVAHIWQHFGKSGASSIDSIELTRAIEAAVLAKVGIVGKEGA